MYFWNANIVKEIEGMDFSVSYEDRIIVYIRHIKSIQGDIESRLMSPTICIGMMFFSASLIIAISVALGRLF